MSPRIARTVLRKLGGTTIVMAVLGIFYNATSFGASMFGALDDSRDGLPVPYLKQAFYVLSVLCVLAYVALIWCGVQFVRFSPRPLWLFIGVLAGEVA